MQVKCEGIGNVPCTWRQSTAQTCEVTDADDNGSRSGARGDEPCSGRILELDQSDARVFLLTTHRSSGSCSKPSAASSNSSSGRRKGWFRGGAAVEGVVVVELGRPNAGPEARALNLKQTTIGGPSAGRVRGRRPRVDNNKKGCLRTIGKRRQPRPTCAALARFGPHTLRRRHVAAHSKTRQ